MDVLLDDIRMPVILYPVINFSCIYQSSPNANILTVTKSVYLELFSAGMNLANEAKIAKFSTR